MGTRAISSLKLEVKSTGSITNTLTDSTVASSAISKTIAQTFTNGVSVNQADRAWQMLNASLGSGANIVIDLYDNGTLNLGAGAGLDALGQSMAIFEIVAIVIKNENSATQAGYLEIEPDATAGWTPIGTHTVATGGALLGGGFLVKGQPATDAFAVTDASSHRIKLTANGAAVSYSIIVFGRSDTDESSSSSSSSSSASSNSSSSESSPSSASSQSSSSSYSSSSVS